MSNNRIILRSDPNVASSNGTSNGAANGTNGHHANGKVSIIQLQYKVLLLRMPYTEYDSHYSI